MCRIRVIHPVLLSRSIMITDENAFSTFGTNIIDKMSPEMICRVSVNPRRNPMFHRVEIEDGVGRSIRELFIILVRGLNFISCFFINLMRLFGLGYERVSEFLIWLELGRLL